MPAMSAPRSRPRSTARPTPGAIYELGGPEVRSLREIIEFILAVTERKRALVSLPFGPASGFGAISELLAQLTLGLLPEDFVLTPDQVKLLRQDNIVSAAATCRAPDLERPRHCAGILPRRWCPPISTRYRKTGQFADQRSA